MLDKPCGWRLYFFMIRNDSGLADVEKEGFVQRLKEKGLKITPQRLAIIEVFLERKDFHPGARLIHEEARKKKRA